MIRNQNLKCTGASLRWTFLEENASPHMRPNLQSTSIFSAFYFRFQVSAVFCLPFGLNDIEMCIFQFTFKLPSQSPYFVTFPNFSGSKQRVFLTWYQKFKVPLCNLPKWLIRLNLRQWMLEAIPLQEVHSQVRPCPSSQACKSIFHQRFAYLTLSFYGYVLQAGRVAFIKGFTNNDE